MTPIRVTAKEYEGMFCLVPNLGGEPGEKEADMTCLCAFCGHIRRDYVVII